MKNKLTKSELANDLLYDTLKGLSEVFSSFNLDLVIVGASARDLGMKLLGADESKRRTADLDVAVAVKDWSQYTSSSEALVQNHFKKLKATQKFVYKGIDNGNDYEVDVVPYGEVADDEIVKWPPKGVPEMSVRCYQDVMSNALDVEIEDIKVRIAPLSGQFLIKLDTWIDRNDRENKDALDMKFIMSEYYMANILACDNLPDVVTVERGDTLLWGAQWIGYETSKMLSDNHLKYYVEFLRQELLLNDKSRLLRHLNIGDEESAGAWKNMKDALKEILGIWKAELEKR